MELTNSPADSMDEPQPQTGEEASVNEKAESVHSESSSSSHKMKIDELTGDDDNSVEAERGNNSSNVISSASVSTAVKPSSSASSTSSTSSSSSTRFSFIFH
jgi:hypothetical protein